MKFIRNVLAVGVIAAASAAACSSQHGATSTGTNTNGGGQVTATNGAQGQLGKVQMAWQIGNGVNIYDLQWKIADGANSYTGDDHFGDAQSAEFVAGGIAAACDYTLTVTGADTNNDPCSGTAAVGCVIPGQTTDVSLIVTCLAPTDAQVSAVIDTGSVAVDAGVVINQVGAYSCPGINSFSIAPAELSGSTQTAALSIATVGPANAISWTASSCRAFTGGGSGGAIGGFFSDSAGTTPSTTLANEFFGCGSCTGQVTVTASVANDEIQPGADAATNVCAGAQYTTFSGLINCEGGGSFTCFPPTPNLCGTNTCVSFNTDPTNCGSCGNVCAAGDTCSGGSCAAKVCPSGDALCADGVTCVPDLTDPTNCGACGHVCPSGDTCKAGACTAPPPSPCTGVGVPAGCTPCTGSPNGVCTATEALIVQRDIDKGLTGANSCYQCLLGSSCIDDTSGDSGNECGDLAGTVGAGAQAAESKSQACVNTLACILGVPYSDLNPVPPEPSADFPGGDVSCGNFGADGVANCYCGSNYPSTPSCNGASGTATPPANGTCEQLELDGLGLLQTTSGSAVLSPYTVKTSGSGMANAILKCAGTNAGAAASCPVCFQ
jgi:hypothetical protein